MKKITKAAVALATVGGALMMVAPAAFADSMPIHIEYNGGVSAAGSMQWQNGTDSSGTVLDQNSSVSAGSLSAETYSSSSSNSGGYGSSTTYTVNPDGSSTTAQQSSYTNNGGNSSLSATDYSSTGSSVTQSQTQNISSADNAEGGTQGQVALSISGKGNLCLDTEWGMTLSVKGVGLAISSQTQNGNEAYGTQMNSSANLQTSNTSAEWLKSTNYSAGSSTASTTYTAGKPSSQSSAVNRASSTTTTMTDMKNPTASLSQDQNQIIGYDSQGGVQSQSGGAGVLPGTLWVSVGGGD